MFLWSLIPLALSSALFSSSSASFLLLRSVASAALFLAAAASSSASFSSLLASWIIMYALFMDTCYRWAKNEHLLDVLLHNSVNTLSFKNLNDFFGQQPIDEKGAVIFEKGPLVAELKLKTWKNCRPSTRGYFSNVSAPFPSHCGVLCISHPNSFW